ncbi:PhnD/SsuA/transferrin family substrate-binding protein [Comamonas sp. Tr-654]|uniref:ABC transporter substrate-binding protein n=1 Tax=Comamonas sp. Tr-654 TaxID=2608341 RepID=UPI00142054F4|nr:ABC transporter substrate-binding protein [Comamonas sp. Tr-654]NIF83252.1 PhnD/SsuA/transferrin family substrate-binding protein [Comamonas sp. Tr-654]
MTHSLISRPWGRRAALAALGLLFGALAHAASPQAIRIGVATAGGGEPINWGGSPGGVVRANQWLEEAFKDSGIKVEWLFFKGAGPAVNEALSNKQIDFAYQGDLPSIVGRANGLRTRVLVTSGARNNLYVVVPPQSGIQRIEELKDRKVAIFRGTNGHLVAINALQSVGLAERDLKAINLDTGSAQAALVSNGVDASFGGYEWFKIRDQGLARVVYSTQGKDPALTRQAALLVREEFEKEHPEQVQKVVNQFVRASNWASDEKNRSELFQLWARTGTPAASWEAEFDKQALAVRNSPLLDEFIVARYRSVAEDAAKLKLIRRPVSLDGWFEPRYLQAALKQQGLEKRWTVFDAKGQVKVRGQNPDASPVALR